MTPARPAAEYRRLGYWRPETLARRFAQTCDRQAAAVALHDGETAVTFREAAMLVERVAGHLHALGVGPGDVVSWQLPNWWEAAIVHHAALRVGATPNPLNLIFRARELRAVLAEAVPRVLVVPGIFRGFDYAALALRLRAETRLVDRVVVARGAAPGALELDALLGEPHRRHAPAAPFDPGAAALLMYTSGTTDAPKGVLHSHETLIYEIESLRGVHGITARDAYLGGSPVTHIAGLVYGVLMPFALGTRTELLERWDAGAAVEAARRGGATFQTGAPTFLYELAEAAGRPGALPAFRLFSTGGAPVREDLVREAAARLGCVVKRAYGSTEAPTLTATTVDDSEDLRLATDGRPIGPAEVRVVTGDAPAQPGDEGEIVARSPEVFIGYRDPARDVEAFDDGGWYRTGDLGVLDERGYLRVTGRLGAVVIRGGENIGVKEIEDLLLEHPSVADVAVLGVPDSRLGERACAVIVPAPGASITFEEMAAFLESKELAHRKIPERLELRSRLPRTQSGKVATAVLRAELERQREGR